VRSGELFLLIVVVEGICKKVEYWKLGFYWIVWVLWMLIVLGFVDWFMCMMGFGLVFVFIGDVVVDMDFICVFYVDKYGIYFEWCIELCLYEEDCFGC